MEVADGGSRCRDWSVNVLYQALSESSFVSLALAIGWQHMIKSNKDKRVFS